MTEEPRESQGVPSAVPPPTHAPLIEAKLGFAEFVSSWEISVPNAAALRTWMTQQKLDPHGHYTAPEWLGHYNVMLGST